MEKWAVLSVGEKKDVCAYKEQYPVQATKILPTISTFYGVNPLVSGVLEIF
jgi:hypothetical protein